MATVNTSTYEHEREREDFGPILFLLYVNDLPLNLSARLDMYADDATLHKSSSCIRQINTTLQDDLLEVQKWCVNNNMVLNPNKTTCMLIGTKI